MEVGKRVTWMKVQNGVCIPFILDGKPVQVNEMNEDGTRAQIYDPRTRTTTWVKVGEDGVCTPFTLDGEPILVLELNEDGTADVYIGEKRINHVMVEDGKFNLHYNGQEVFVLEMNEDGTRAQIYDPRTRTTTWVKVGEDGVCTPFTLDGEPILVGDIRNNGIQESVLTRIRGTVSWVIAENGAVLTHEGCPVIERNPVRSIMIVLTKNGQIATVTHNPVNQDVGSILKGGK